MHPRGRRWYGMAWHGMVWHGMAWHGMAWHGIVWHGIGMGLGLENSIEELGERQLVGTSVISPLLELVECAE